MEVDHWVNRLVGVHGQAWEGGLDVLLKVIHLVHKLLSTRMLERKHCMWPGGSKQQHEASSVRGETKQESAGNTKYFCE